MTKPKKDKFYLVQEDILPEAIKKTIKVKEILKLGEVKTINEAVEKMDLSRSAYYKYKDYVFPFFEIAQGKIVSIYVSMSNESGMLSSVLKAIAERNGSILTINQDIPLQGIANSSISFETKDLQGSLEDLLAESGPYLLDLASKNGVDLRFEASVLGGIPIIRTLYESLAGNRITEIIGIMNGTTNFILTKMSEEGLSYQDVLKEAQDLGYAEADPTADVEGLDAARKLAILASISFNRRIFFEDVSVEGITSIDTEDIKFGKEFGYNIKLLGIAKETSQGLSLNVYPAFIPTTHPLASVRGSYNAIYVKGNGIDDVMLYGRGAGSLPTGSSVVSDIMEVAKNVSYNETGRLKPFYYDQKNIYAPGKIQSSYYLRLEVDNKTGVLAKISAKLAEQKISVLSIVQRNMDPETAVLAIVTSKCPRSYILNLIDSFNSLRSVKSVNSVIRIMEA